MHSGRLELVLRQPFISAYYVMYICFTLEIAGIDTIYATLIGNMPSDP